MRNFNFNAVSSVCFANFLSETGPNRASLRSTLLHNFPFHLEVTCIVGIKIDSSLHSVMEEHRRIVQLRPKSKLLRSTIWITSGLLLVFQIFARNFAIGFPVALQWLVLEKELIVPSDLMQQVSLELFDHRVIL